MPAVVQLSVRRSVRVSAHFQRVTVGGPALDRMPNAGLDQWFRMFFRLLGQDRLRLPECLASSRTDTAGTVEATGWYQQWLAMPEEQRPGCRNYTVRAFRPDDRELDIDFVLHPGPSGRIDSPDAGWAVRAEPDEPVVLLDQGTTFAPSAGSRGVLLAGEESALPALEGILAGLDPTTRGRAVLEVPERDDIRPLTHPTGVTLDWVVRTARSPGSVPGRAALEHVRDGPPVDRLAYVFVAGESGLATGLRRHLVRAGHDPALIRFAGYWKSERTTRAA